MDSETANYSFFMAGTEVVKTQAVGKHPEKDGLERERKQVH